MSFDPITHHMTKIAESQQHAITRVTPIVRLGNSGSIVCLQGGGIYSEDGTEVKEPEGWVYEAMGKMSPAALQSVGFSKAPERPSTVAAAPPEPAGPVMWSCPDCNKIMDERNKTAHIAKHNRHLGAANQIPNVPASTQH